LKKIKEKKTNGVAIQKTNKNNTLTKETSQSMVLIILFI